MNLLVTFPEALRHTLKQPLHVLMFVFQLIIHLSPAAESDTVEPASCIDKVGDLSAVHVVLSLPLAAESYIYISLA